MGVIVKDVGVVSYLFVNLLWINVFVNGRVVIDNVVCKWRFKYVSVVFGRSFDES